MPKQTLYVRLLSHTPDPESVVAMGARLCYSGARVDELAEKVASTDQTAFLQKLVDIGHLSPVEHASFTFGVEGVSRALLAQLTRHRIASFSVQSQRYVNQTGKEGFHYIVPPSIEVLGEKAVARFEKQMHMMQTWYDEWVAELSAAPGSAKEKANEDARFVLPNAAETRLVMTMNARELQHLFAVRCCNRAQWEIRALAWAMLAQCLAVAPNLFSACGPSCVNGFCTEGVMACGKRVQVRETHQSLMNLVGDYGQEEDFAQTICNWMRDEL